MKRLNFFFLALTMLFSFSSCTEENEIVVQRSDDYAVTFDEAKIFAQNHFAKKNAEKGVNLRSDDFGDSKTFKGKDDLPGLHIFNYENDEEFSFVIISGDNRITPVLAYGDDKFPLDYIQYGIADWMKKQIDFIDSIRTTDLGQTDFINGLWENDLPVGWDCCEECPNWPDCQYDNIGCGDEGINCNGVSSENPCGNITTAITGPLMSTRWGQNCPYNLSAPSDGCNDICGNDRTLTGCVATAMSQVIRFHEFPSDYDYDIMLNRAGAFQAGNPGAIEIAQLMFDAGDAVDMDWGCNGSGASTCDVPDALEVNFGYTNGGNCGSYSTSYPVKSSLNSDRPVILAGCADGISLFDWTYNDCHAWVCDGYKTYDNLCYGYLFYHMNWGWNGFGNGWYAYNSWAPINSGFDFAHNKRQIIYITP